ncbi:hypothetical protein [Micromonospora sp. NPDC049497]|uniref:hypothetical protein n=1 Tax=Micromonospora sp. NPDC049497 TaxID=3364273 RepID=UPI0037919DD2
MAGLSGRSRKSPAAGLTNFGSPLIRLQSAPTFSLPFARPGVPETLNGLWPGAEQRDRARRGDLKDQAINGNCFTADEQKSADPPRRPPTAGTTTDADRLPRDSRPDLGAYERR